MRRGDRLLIGAEHGDRLLLAVVQDFEVADPEIGDEAAWIAATMRARAEYTTFVCQGKGEARLPRLKTRPTTEKLSV